MGMLDEANAALNGGSVSTPTMVQSANPGTSSAPASSGMLADANAALTGQKAPAAPSTKISTLPSWMGGGAYINAGDQLVKDPRNQSGLGLGAAQPGMERDHIVPVSLGGVSSPENAQMQQGKPNQQGTDTGTKDNIETYASYLYQNGKISLPQARSMVINWKDVGVPNDIQWGKISIKKAKAQSGTDESYLYTQNPQASEQANANVAPITSDKQGDTAPSIDNQGNVHTLRVGMEKGHGAAGVVHNVFGSLFNTTMNAVDNAGNAGKTILGDTLNPLVNKISNKIKPGSGNMPTVNSGAQAVADVAHFGQAELGLVPSWLAFNAELNAAKDSGVPGVSQLAKGVNNIFGWVQQKSSDLALKGINAMPMSNQTKATLGRPVADLIGTIAQLGIFKGADEIASTGGEKIMDKTDMSEEAKANVSGTTKAVVGTAMNPGGTLLRVGQALISNIAEKAQKAYEANKGALTPDDAAAIVNEAVKETPATVPATLKVTTASGKEINVDTQQGLVLKNLIKGNEDLQYRQVRNLGKDTNGNPIAARFLWDYDKQQGTILYNNKSTVGDLVHEFGHYMDRNLATEVGQKLSDLLPDFKKNETDIVASLGGYVANLLARGQEIKANDQYTKELQSGKTPNLDRYQKTSEGLITPKMIDKGIKNFVDKIHQQVFDLTGGIGASVFPKTEGENAINPRAEEIGQKINELNRQYVENPTSANKKALESAKAAYQEVQNTVTNKAGNTNQIVNETRNDFGEKFATAVRNILVNPEEARKIAPELTDYIKHQSQFMGWMSDRLSHTAIDTKIVGERPGATTLGEIQNSEGRSGEKVAVQEKSPAATNFGGKKTTETAQTTQKTGFVEKAPKGKSVTTESVNWDKINAPEDVISTMKEVASSYDQFSNVRRKTTLQEQLDFSMKFLGDDSFAKTLPEEMKNNAGRMLAAQQMMTDLAKDLTDGLRTTDKSDTEGMKTIAQKYLQLTGIMQAFAGARTAAGQTLGALRNEIALSENSVAMTDLVNALKEVGLNEQSKSIEDTMKKVRAVKPTGAPDRFWQLWYLNNIFLGPGTYEKHIMGNLIHVGTEFVSRLGLNTIKGDPMQSLKEMSAYYQGWMEQFKQTFGQRKLEEKPPGVGTVVKEAEEMKPNPLIQDKFTKIVEWPGKFLQNLNALFYRGASEMEQYSIARDQARQEAKTNSGIDVDKRTQEILDKGLGQEELQKADEFAKRMTFTEQMRGGVSAQGLLGGIGNAISKATHTTYTERLALWENLKATTINAYRSVTGGEKYEPKVGADKMGGVLFKTVARMVVPVIRTHIDVINAGLDLTPFGLADLGLASDVAKGEVDRMRQLQMARAVMGTLSLLSIAPYAMSGNVTGNGPADPNQKKTLTAGGWKANSFRIPGTNKWIPLTYLGPLMVPLGILGNLHDTIKYNKTPDESWQAMASASFIASAKTLSQEPFFTATSQFLDAVTNVGTPQSSSYWSRFGTSEVESLIPLAPVMNKIHSFFDPKQYQTNDVKSYILKNLGITSNLKEQLNVFGENTGTAKPDEVSDFLGKSNIAIGMPNKATKLTLSDGTQRIMTPDEYYQYVKISGQEIHSQIENNLSYLQSITDRSQLTKEIKGIEAQARKDAKEQINTGK